MPSAKNNAVYNSRIPHMRVSSSRFPRVVGFLVLILMHAPIILAAADWRPPEEQLARKIAATTGPGAVALDVMNRSSLSRADVEEIRRGLLTRLGVLGVRFVNADQAAAIVQITISENLQNYVWAAEIRQGNNEISVVMVATPRMSPTSVEHTTAPLTIHKTLLWTDEMRVLDVALVNSGPQHVIVLEPERVVLSKFRDGRWQQEQSLPLSHSRPWPRDLRGRLILRRDYLFDVYLPGTFCRSTTSIPLSLNCYESDDPWPLGTNEPAVSAFHQEISLPARFLRALRSKLQ
jgi:hypothetical protein